MNTRLFNAILIGSILHLAAVTPGGAAARWNRVAPQGAGFSIEAPGDPQPTPELGDHVYSSGLWLLSIKVQAVDPYTRQLVDRRDRKAVEKCLETIRDAFMSGVGAKRVSSSSGKIDGYPSLRFSLENDELEGTNLLVLTGERLFIVMAVGPKGSSNDDAKRFLKSFRLVAMSQ